ncbi:hypothetical protein FPCIR_6225 [Fusarium pseudocircinatum]|uniref:Uncharacterized protein n=1 Tax=Fusarium pseudocircinatum TaxID=56676 RepID=A0A8H5P596_9HYPO|nr:hypothetical protein FPCIR_6225 [Fusarium pseudocircinatum]
MADGSLIHVDGPGPFDCEMYYVAVGAQTVKGSKNQDSEEMPTKGSENCDLLRIKFSDNGVVHRGCCKDGVAVFAPQEHQVLSPQPIDPIDGVQKPIQHLHKGNHITEEEGEENEDGDKDYEDYGVNEDTNDENSPDSGAGHEPEAQQDNQVKVL